jgi:hypothetical protein
MKARVYCCPRLHSRISSIRSWNQKIAPERATKRRKLTVVIGSESGYFEESSLASFVIAASGGREGMLRTVVRVCATRNEDAVDDDLLWWDLAEGLEGGLLGVAGVELGGGWPSVGEDAWAVEMGRGTVCSSTAPSSSSSCAPSGMCT